MRFEISKIVFGNSLDRMYCVGIPRLVWIRMRVPLEYCFAHNIQNELSIRSNHDHSLGSNSFKSSFFQYFAHSSLISTRTLPYVTFSLPHAYHHRSLLIFFLSRGTFFSSACRLVQNYNRKGEDWVYVWRGRGLDLVFC